MNAKTVSGALWEQDSAPCLLWTRKPYQAPYGNKIQHHVYYEHVNYIMCIMGTKFSTMFIMNTKTVTGALWEQNPAPWSLWTRKLYQVHYGNKVQHHVHCEHGHCTRCIMRRKFSTMFIMNLLTNQVSGRYLLCTILGVTKEGRKFRVLRRFQQLRSYRDME